MDNTEIKLILSVFGDKFDPIELTHSIGIEPTKSWLKGDPIPNRPKHVIRQETAWEFSIGYVPTLDIQELTAMFNDVFTQKTLLIRNFSDLNKLETKVDVVIKMSNEQIPSVFLDRKFLDNINILNATIDFDFYLNTE